MAPSLAEAHCPRCGITLVGMLLTLILLQLGSEQQGSPADKDPHFRQTCPVLKSQGRNYQNMTPTVDRRRVWKLFFYLNGS